jgi:hypothetical protein
MLLLGKLQPLCIHRRVMDAGVVEDAPHHHQAISRDAIIGIGAKLVR